MNSAVFSATYGWWQPRTYDEFAIVIKHDTGSYTTCYHDKRSQDAASVTCSVYAYGAERGHC